MHHNAVMCSPDKEVSMSS